MKLIDEKEVEEAAKEYASIRNYENEIQFILDKEAFNKGASFAEQKLQPMMVEFGELCRMEAHIGAKTTEQLLEQFLKPKTNES